MEIITKPVICDNINSKIKHPSLSQRPIEPGETYYVNMETHNETGSPMTKDLLVRQGHYDPLIDIFHSNVAFISEDCNIDIGHQIIDIQLVHHLKYNIMSKHLVVLIQTMAVHGQMLMHGQQ